MVCMSRQVVAQTPLLRPGTQVQMYVEKMLGTTKRFALQCFVEKRVTIYIDMYIMAILIVAFLFLFFVCEGNISPSFRNQSDELVLSNLY